MPPQVLLDVQGVGYEIDVPMSTFYPACRAIGEEVTLHTHLVVREDAHLLYGFATEAERSAFRQLSRSRRRRAYRALGALGLSVADLADAVTHAGHRAPHKVPGIGKKTAERLLLELQGQAWPELVAGSATTRPRRHRSDVLNALLALGYNERKPSPR